jgi:hypothetical protein
LFVFAFVIAFVFNFLIFLFSVYYPTPLG